MLFFGGGGGGGNLPPKLKPRPKHSIKFHVWGAISKCGATDVYIFEGENGCTILHLNTAVKPASLYINTFSKQPSLHARQ